MLNLDYRVVIRTKLMILVAIKVKVAMENGLQIGIILIEISRSLHIESLPTVKFFWLFLKS